VTAWGTVRPVARPISAGVGNHITASGPSDFGIRNRTTHEGGATRTREGRANRTTHDGRANRTTHEGGANRTTHEGGANRTTHEGRAAQVSDLGIRNRTNGRGEGRLPRRPRSDIRSRR
jgi:hypothetical protein